MSNEKRFVLFLVLMFAYLLGYPYLMRLLGVNPLPRKPPAARPAVAASGQDQEKKGELARAKTPAKDQDRPGAGRSQEPALPAAKAAVAAAQGPKEPTVELVAPEKLVLGSVGDKSHGGYRLEVRLDQNGAGVDSVVSSRYDAEFEDGVDLKSPLELI